MKPLVAIRHVPHEGLGLLEDILHGAGLSFRYVDMFDRPDRKINLDRLAGLVVMGGPMNVDDVKNYPWLRWEIDWIQGAVERRIPLLGVCLGAQLLARACGADIYTNPVREIGWFDVQITEHAATDPLFREFRATERVFQWHGDTFDLPQGAIQLARSQLCEHQAFRYGDSAFGLQFHIEMTATLLESWLVEPCMCAELDDLGPAAAERLRRETGQHLPAMTDLAECAFGNFAELCRHHGREERNDGIME